MGYKLLGFVVWQGGKWYLRRRLGGTRTKLIAGGVAAMAIGGAVAAAQRSGDSD